MSAASTFDDFRPPRPAGMGRGALLALLVHAGLLIALAFGVSWRSSEPTGATAELWAAVPETAAPVAQAPPEPKPAPPPPKVEPEPVKPQVRDADVAIEKAKAEKAKREREAAEAQKKREEQQAKAEREKAQKAEAAKAERAEAERIAKLREEQLKRIAGQAGSTGAPTATGSAARDAGPSAGYAGRIVAKVKPNIVFADSVPASLRAEVEVRAAPDGTIVGRRLVKASGNKDWDDAVLRAIDRTEILPRDVDGRVPSPIVIEFRP
ncbi:MAG TPA: cell envelope integrity protein TolA [Burkholderiaceae bacterium]|nr:cell envelope integrity protein TolA [Burkholderiaceae bacterium]